MPRSRPGTPRIPKIHVDTFGLQSHDKRQWHKRGDFSRLTERSLVDFMNSPEIHNDASNVNFEDPET
eukprot:9988513-Karenia_brevis.AAC.1